MENELYRLIIKDGESQVLDKDAIFEDLYDKLDNPKNLLIHVANNIVDKIDETQDNFK